MPEMMNTQQDQRPVPDPTILTTDQLRREIGQLEKTVNLQFDTLGTQREGESKLTTERFEALDDRYRLQTRALDAAFAAQTTAMEAAFAASETAVQAALETAQTAIREGVILTDEKISTIAERLVGLQRETEANQTAAAAHLQAEVVWTGERFKSVQISQDAATHAEASARDADRELFTSQISSLREMLNERYQTQTKALDAAFVAQQAAVATSFDASEKAMAAALLAAKEAVEKANVATEKRFDNVTGLLAQQNATLSLLSPRNEVEAKLKALDDRMSDMKSTVDKGFTGVETRHSGEGEGRDIRAEERAKAEADRARMGMYIGFVIAGLSVLIAIIVPIFVVLMHR